MDIEELSKRIEIASVAATSAAATAAAIAAEVTKERVDRIDTHLDKVTEDLIDVRLEIAKLKTRMSVIGGVMIAVWSVITALLVHFLGR